MVKREREEACEPQEKVSKAKGEPGHEESRPSAAIIGISRTIGACQRCRQKKVKCDQQFPSCAKCHKAGVSCVGLDPATGRQIPRSYIVYLEDKITTLEKQLRINGLEPGSSSSGTPETRPEAHSPAAVGASDRRDAPAGPKQREQGAKGLKGSPKSVSSINSASTGTKDASIPSSIKLNVPSTNTGLSFYLGDSSGISFARLLFTAVNFHPNINEDNSITIQGPTRDLSQNLLSGLPSKPNAELYIKTYFEQSNAQLPILHREHFINNYFKPVYGNFSPDVKLACNYTKPNFDTSPIDIQDTWYYKLQKSHYNMDTDVPDSIKKCLFYLNIIFAISTSIHLLQHNTEISNSYKLEAMRYIDSLYQSDDRLELLQALLLLTLYSLMRPSVPGVWYILGTLIRLTVDLGLHTEKLNFKVSPFTRDLRRRLFWCTYSLDRQICVYLGRPFGIPEESISTLFPFQVDDCLINPDDQEEFVSGKNSLPTYKIISINFFKIRKIQSEILQYLYFTNSTIPRFYHDLQDWKMKVNDKIETWFKTIPLKIARKSNCDFNTNFFKLNYYHTKLLLFGLNPKNPKLNQESLEIVFNASKGIINCYNGFFEDKVINYTWAAVHNLFMAGTSFFYSIYHSQTSLISIGEFEKVCGSVIKVLTSLVELCDAAQSCIEIFELLSLAIIKLKFDDSPNYHPNEMNTSFNNLIGREVTSEQIQGIDKFFNQLNTDKHSDVEGPQSSVFKDFQYSGYQQVLGRAANVKPEGFFGMPNQQQPPQQLQNQQMQNQQQIHNQQLQTQQLQTQQVQIDNNDENYPSLSTPPATTPFNDMTLQDYEQRRVFDLMTEVSNEHIWDQFFGNGNFGGY